jgi:hypothetical protein
VPGRQRRAERAAGIARRRLHPEPVEAAVAQHLAVGDAVERDAAGEAEVARAVLGGEAARQRSTTSSVTACTEAARSMWRWVSGSSGRARRAAEQRVEAREVILRPVQ